MKQARAKLSSENCKSASSVDAATNNSNPDRGYMGLGLTPSLATSVVSVGEVRRVEGRCCKQPSMASRLTPPSPTESFSDVIDIPDFLPRRPDVGMKPEVESRVISITNENIQGTA